MRFNRADLLKYVEPESHDPKVQKVAKAIASHYKALCKSKVPWLEPYKTTVPVECQKVFQHFVQAAELIFTIEQHEEIDLRAFVQAQFDGLAWTNKLPYVTQLHTPAALSRYYNYITKYKTRVSKKLQTTDFQEDTYAFEERKATRIAEQLGVSTRRAIRTMPGEFSPGFLRKYNIEATKD